MEQQWEERASRARERYEDGVARLPDDGDERQRQLTRMGNAAWAAGLSYLMLGRSDAAAEWLGRAADRYRESWPTAPAGSWGRPIGAMKSRLLAGEPERAREEARWALDAGAAESESPIGRYAAALAALVLGDDARAGELAGSLRGRDDFPATGRGGARGGRRGRPGAVRGGDPCAARRLREPRRLPGGRARRGHRPRPATPRRGARHRRSRSNPPLLPG